jgi:hypothetical protein
MPMYRHICGVLELAGRHWIVEPSTFGDLFAEHQGRGLVATMECRLVAPIPTDPEPTC